MHKFKVGDKVIVKHSDSLLQSQKEVIGQVFEIINLKTSSIFRGQDFYCLKGQPDVFYEREIELATKLHKVLE